MRTAAFALLCVSAAALAGDPPREIARRILAARDPADRGRLVDELVATNADPREVAKWFAEGRTYAAEVATGWLDLEVTGSDGKNRPYLLHVPETYEPGKRYGLLIDLHGGVSRPRTLSHEELGQMKFFWAENAEKEGWFLAIPSGEVKAEWWTDLGSGNVLSILEETRRRYDIDENRVFATGFSDGGSGSFYLALTQPTVLAGVIPLNGHVAVAQAGGLQVHVRNFLNVPVYAVNTENDQLYPSAGMKPLIDAMKELGANVTWRDVPGYGHDPRYLPAERPAIWAWIAATRREPHPKSVTWEGAAPGRVRWLRVTELGGDGGAEFPDVNPDLPPNRPRIGVVIDQQFEGPGLRIMEVQEGSPAAAIGIAPNDVITGLDGAAIADMQALQQALREKKFGDGFKIALRRGEAAIEKEGKFPDARPEPGLRREKPYGSIRAEVKDAAQWTAYPPLSAAGKSGTVVDVKAKGVHAFDLYLGEPLFDLTKPVTVVVNGKVVHEGVVAPDLRFLAEQAGADGDRTMIYLARLRIALGP